MNRITCWINALPFFIRTGIWCPHIYKEEKIETAIVISTPDSFRISDNYQHLPNETVHKKATVTTCKCIYCGKESKSWFDKEPMILKT